MRDKGNNNNSSNMLLYLVIGCLIVYLFLFKKDDKKDNEQQKEQDLNKPTLSPLPVPIEGARITHAGDIGMTDEGWGRVVRKKYVGDFTASRYLHNDQTKIVHNLGHTNYIVVGQCLGGKELFFKMNCFAVSDNECFVSISDDSTGNVADFRFMVISFQKDEKK